MVALAGSGWRLAPCLIALFEQADARWPKRSRVSDGSIGDKAHAARKSDHNPSETGYVTAGDLTHDPDMGPDAHAWAEYLRTIRDSRVKYVISNGRVWRSYGTSAWQWTPYTGSNAHEKHVHVSVLDIAEVRNDLRPWFPPVIGDSTTDPPEEDEMPAPAIVRDSRGNRWVFARGTDGALWYKLNDDPFKIAPFAENKPNTMGSGPTAWANLDGTIEITAAGTTGDLFLCVWNTAIFEPWVPLGGKTA